MNALIDTHAHIYAAEFRSDLPDAIVRAQETGLRKIFMPNIDHTSIDSMLEVEHKYPDLCVPMMGLHPCSVKKDFEKELYLVEDWLSKRKFAAVGEMGTDLYWDKTFWQEQQEAFRIQVGFAKKYKLPLVIHCRESVDETIEMLGSLAGNGLTGIFHCFGGNLHQAKAVMDMGFYIGLGGVVTFKNGGLDKIVPDLPLDRIVLETDAPYLAPVPHRGKRNEPAYISLVAERVSFYMNVDVEKVKEAAEINAMKIFNTASGE